MAALTEEQSLIKDQAKSWVTEQSPVLAFRNMRDSGEPLGFTQANWQAMVEMGWTGILVPEAFGGSDLGYLTFGVILEEMGRQLAASPLYASALVGTSAVLLAGSEQQKSALLSGVVDGSQILALALEEGSSSRAGTYRAAGNCRWWRLRTQRQQDLRAGRHGRHQLYRAGPHQWRGRGHGRHYAVSGVCRRRRHIARAHPHIRQPWFCQRHV